MHHATKPLAASCLDRIRVVLARFENVIDVANAVCVAGARPSFYV